LVNALVGIGKHAVNIGNESSLVELFNYACSTLGVVFLSMSLCSVLRFSQESMWYIVQIAQLIALRAHVQAYKRRVRRVALAGPGEVLLVILLVFLVRVISGLDWFYYLAGISLSLWLSLWLSLSVSLSLWLPTIALHSA
jgi:hypothetical protein